MRNIVTIPALFALAAAAYAADPQSLINPDLLKDRWSASWIAPAGAAPFDYGVYHFRRTFELAVKPSSFIVHASGDNRYQLYVNGRRVAWGPARGDLFHWRYETVDVAPHLKPGKNVLAAVVWNYSEMAPMAQVTNRTAFLLQGNTQAERIADTNVSWKAARNPACRPLPVTSAEMRGYFVVGPGEEVDGAAYPWGWEQADFDDSSWPSARVVVYASARDARDSHSPWMLIPRTIPMMEEKAERFARAREAEGVTVPPEFPAARAPLRIGPQSKARILLDQSHLTTAYPELEVSGGRGATVTLRYAESLYEQGARRGDKGDRNAVKGKTFIGYRDAFKADGGANRLFRPLWWRTYKR